jgi:hypothetical protein
MAHDKALRQPTAMGGPLERAAAGNLPIKCAYDVFMRSTCDSLPGQDVSCEPAQSAANMHQLTAVVKWSLSRLHLMLVLVLVLVIVIVIVIVIGISIFPSPVLRTPSPHARA